MGRRRRTDYRQQIAESERRAANARRRETETEQRIERMRTKKQSLLDDQRSSIKGQIKLRNTATKIIQGSVVCKDLGKH